MNIFDVASGRTISRAGKVSRSETLYPRPGNPHNDVCSGEGSGGEVGEACGGIGDKKE